MNKLAPSGPENEQTEINEVIIYNMNTNMIVNTERFNRVKATDCPPNSK